jgi:hypothetical protein
VAFIQRLKEVMGISETKGLSLKALLGIAGAVLEIAQ